MKTSKSKSIMFALAFLISAVFANTAFAQAQKKANKDTKNWRYEIECFGNGNDGTYLIKVWSYSKKPAVATEQSKKNAVHGVIFQGFGGGEKGCIAQKPLTTNSALEQEKEEFFNDFFADGGKYMKYVGMANDGVGSPGDRIKMEKEYKVGVVVSVRKDELRKYLEDAGIINSLNTIFNK